MKHILKVLANLKSSIAEQPVRQLAIRGSEVTDLSGQTFAQIVPKCLQTKLLRVVPLAIVIIIPLSSFPALACRQTVKQNVTGNISNAELAIIADIKKAYIGLALNSANPSKVAAELGTVTKVSPKNDQEVKPFNPALQSVQITTDSSSASYPIYSIELIAKPRMQLSTVALKREFGDYVEPPTLSFNFNGTSSSEKTVLTYIFYPEKIKPNYIAIAVNYDATPRRANFGTVIKITVITDPDSQWGP